MSQKFKLLKIVREVGSTTKAVGPSMTKLEADEFAKYDIEVVEVADTDKNALAAALKGADLMLYGGVPITSWMMEAAPKCIAILAQTVGYDPIDIKNATAHNILVVNNPSFEWCVEEVSNHAMTLLLACAKKVKILDSLTCQGRWAEARKTRSPMAPIYGQTLGIIGCGSIGRMVARKAHCLGLKTVGYDPYVEKWLAKENGITLVNLPELLKQSDYVSAHPDLNETSRHMMGEKEFKQMKPSAYFINTSRGKIVDEAALIKALKEKWIIGAGLDVLEKEPVEKDNPLLKMDNVIMLPHSAAFSDYAIALGPVISAKEAGRILIGELPSHIVNKSVKPKCELVKRN